LLRVARLEKWYQQTDESLVLAVEKVDFLYNTLMHVERDFTSNGRR
jgi:hypothetical protein